MKQKDIIIIIIIVFFTGIASYFLSTKLFASEKQRSIEVKTVDAISTDFNKPSKQYFNENSVNPTQIITIGDQPQSSSQ